MPIWKGRQFGNFVPHLFVQALHTPRSKNSSGVYCPKYQKNAHFLLVSLSVYPRSRRGAKRIRQGEGRWSRPPKTALDRIYLTENSSSENRRCQAKQTVWRECQFRESQTPSETNAREYAKAKFKTSYNSLPFGNDDNFVNHPGAAEVKIQPKSPEFLLDMRCFCNFSLVSLGIRPRSRRGAERTRQGEGRLSGPPKPALERSYLTENCSSTNRILKPRHKKLLTESLNKKDPIYIYTKAPHGRRHSPAPMLRVGEGGTRTRKRGKSCGCSIRHYYCKFKVIPRV